MAAGGSGSERDRFFDHGRLDRLTSRPVEGAQLAPGQFRAG
jgi:hypothetical protein